MKAKAKKPQPKQLAPSWDLVGPSWRLLRENFELVIFLFILPSLLLVLGGLLLGETKDLHHLSDVTSRQRVGLALMGLSLVWSIINFAPSLYFRLKVTAGKSVGLSTCYRKGLRYFWRLFGLNIFLFVMLFLGFLLFIVPGIILLILFINRYYLAWYYLVDRDLGIRAALARSRQETAAYAGNIWGLIGVQLSFSLVASVISAVSRLGSVVAIFIQLVCLFLPALRYQEIKTAQSSGAR